MTTKKKPDPASVAGSGSVWVRNFGLARSSRVRGEGIPHGAVVFGRKGVWVVTTRRRRVGGELERAGLEWGRLGELVATDILGVSGRAMLDALVAGTTDPEVLADLAKGRLRAKLPALRETLEGRFDHLHAVWIGAILAHLDFLDEQIAGLTETIGEQIAPFERAVELLCTIPGVQRRTAECIVAEIGVE